MVDGNKIIIIFNFIYCVCSNYKCCIGKSVLRTLMKVQCSIKRNKVTRSCETGQPAIEIHEFEVEREFLYWRHEMSGHYWHFVTAILLMITFFSTKIVVLVAILNNASFKWMARNPLHLAYFFHIFAPTTKALFKFFRILKKTRITMEFSDKVDSIKYSTVP